VSGIGINPTKSDADKTGLGLPEGYIDHTQLRLDEVWKCPACGHSADMKQTEKKTITVTRTMTRKINRCYDCLYYFSHPREAECQHPSVQDSNNPYAGIGILDGNQMTGFPVKCPLLKE